MAATFNLPDVGEGLTEAEVVAWRVAVGDQVDVNDVVVEIETAKSVVELPIPYAGVVRELVADEGETLEVGQPLIRIAVEGGTEDDGGPVDDAGATGTGQQDGTGQEDDRGQHQTAGEDTGTPGDAGFEPAGALVGSGPKADVARRRPRTRHTELDLVDVSDMDLPEVGRGPELGRVPESGAGRTGIMAKASPPVRALARRLGLTAWELVGSGYKGQITRDDVEHQAQQKKAQQRRTWRTGSEKTAAAPPATSSEPPRTPAAAGLLYEGPREEQVTVRGVRRATAANVTQVASTVPHVSVSREVDLTRTMELRTVLKRDPSFEDLSVSPTLFAAKAIIWALRRNPQINASWHETHYTLKNYVNLGIAAATPRGLVVPVIHEAHTYNTLGLAAAITQLTSDAREGRTTPGQMQGGTVSITNVGPLGIDTGTPILPPGQAGIVLLGAVRRKPWVLDGEIVPREIITIGGSFDHRLIDGDHAGKFISDVAAVLEEPGLLLD